MDYQSTNAWRFTGFYGSPTVEGKSVAWNILRALRTHHALPWLCVGDFNELLSNGEKWGRRPRPESQMTHFRQVVDDCGFLDLGFLGPSFTWCNNQTGDCRVLERLDRSFATSDWLLRFPNCRVHHMHAVFSDHRPLWMELNPSARTMRPKRKQFRFEAMWLMDPRCEEQVQQAWMTEPSGSPMTRVFEKIKNSKQSLYRWSRDHFGSVRSSIDEKTKQLEHEEAAAPAMQNGLVIKSLRQELYILHAKEEQMWKQRSRTQWLQHGDRNTRFFHCQATCRQRRNRIQGITDEAGVWQQEDDKIEAGIVSYYKSLFTSFNPVELEEVLDGVTRVVSNEMNDQLLCDFTASEVEQALFQMGPLKAPGPDGMSPIFYQKFWHIVGSDVTAGVLSCLRDGVLLQKINHTNICLIPKIQNPLSTKDYRPISLCNVVYKIVAKVLANRLKKVLPQVISETQSAFVPGRLISDNILIAFETLHHMHQMRQGQQGYMALKLDMSKAYDRVEWVFLERIMLTMGFHRKWVDLMMGCVRSVSYSVLINGEPRGYFYPSRGLRQGDPISPYLFLFCAEGLHTLLTRATVSRQLQGLSISRGGPKLTYLFFADDSVLFCRATLMECNTIIEILRKYERASGQQLNQDKTTLFFSTSTAAETQEEIKVALQLPVITQYETYFLVYPQWWVDPSMLHSLI